MTISDSDWAEMTDRERDAKVAEVVLGDTVEIRGNGPYVQRNVIWWPAPRYTSTWPGFGLVVDRMRGLGFWLNLYDYGGNWEAQWFKTDSERYMDYGDSAPSATALAAVRAIQEGDVK